MGHFFFFFFFFFFFLKTGVTLACFQRFGTLHLAREELMRSVRGTDKGRAKKYFLVCFYHYLLLVLT